MRDCPVSSSFVGGDWGGSTHIPCHRPAKRSDNVAFPPRSSSFFQLDRKVSRPIELVGAGGGLLRQSQVRSARACARAIDTDGFGFRNRYDRHSKRATLLRSLPLRPLLRVCRAREPRGQGVKNQH